MKDSALRDHVVLLGRSLYERGYAHGSTGNISVKTDDGWLLSPTNSCLGRLDPAKLSRMSWEGRLLDGDAPSKEAFLHLAMYQQRASFEAIVHLHSMYSTALSTLVEIDPDDALPPLTAYYVMRVGRLPVIPYFKPGDMALAQAVGNAARKHHAVLLANHGPVVAGTSLTAAVDAVEELEQTARLFLLLRGEKIRALTLEQADDLRQAYPPPP